MKLSPNRIFLREFFRRFHHTGAILPSSRHLAHALAKPLRERGNDQPLKVLEVGPGIGSVTQELVRELGPNDHLDLVEINEEFVRVLKERIATEDQFQRVRDRVQLLCQPIEELASDRSYDVIVSGLPLNNFEIPEVEQILNQFQVLACSGTRVSFFEYVAVRRLKSMVSPGRATRTRLRGITNVLTQFLKSEISRDTIWRNVPPAWVHHLRLPDNSHVLKSSIAATDDAPSVKNARIGDGR